MAPTAAPTMAPTAAPTMAPTAAPTMAPTAAPTMAPTAAPTTAPTSAPSPESSGIYTPCPSGTYWEVGATACRGPSYVGECYNPATAKYQNGCAPGFTCINNKCSTIPPATFSPSVCYIKCTESDEYCENGTNTCRGPSYAGECFNVATGRYQNGCGLGYRCANNMCHLNSPKMQIFTLVSSLLTVKILSLTAQTVDNSTSMINSLCDQPCENFDEYCEPSTGVCRGPNYDGECFNPATSTFQDGCDPGFECIDNKCDYVQDFGTDSYAEASCGVQCSVFGEYCDNTLNECRAPSGGECYNAVTSTFQDGCDEGFECMDNMCQVITSVSSNTVCYHICSVGTYCENGTDECRGPNYDGECFNSATGFFQNGCDPGFICTSNNNCEYA
ncbi:Carbohydrate-binding protein [Phytophthora palmivora]|uniref:Carbohydrate-binding protein n=1 Tax=Phytophthora palmivora TaxID=4796 RepID=A0A2P4YHQ3_9STRA|nr:Carbohydrate-binding protein [Phytophthora palmivora]